MVGYTGGEEKWPTYKSIKDHTEALRVVFDPDVITYEQLLRFFWDSHTPSRGGRRQYRSAVWPTDDVQAAAVAAVRAKIGPKAEPTDVDYAGPFYRAEEYHQQYIAKSQRR